AAVADHGGSQRGARAAVLVVDVLDHLLAPLVLEIDVDVRRLVAFLRQESRQQQTAFGGVDGSNAEREADRGVGGRTAPLAEDPSSPGEADDVLDGEE